ncbi:glycosyltransferase [Humibacillus xanthopallidus]|uniref:glycosyltransferase n=1 Tax=Humibacillus xanthopallidus TaxID=412689 RepID=UPI00163AE7F2
MEISHGTDDVTERRVVALIVTFRRREDLLRTLDSVRAQTSAVCQVVVVDNSPERECSSYLSNVEGVQLLSSGQNLGFSGGLHYGLIDILGQGQADLVWILDDDSPVAPDSLARGLATLSKLPAASSLSNRGFVFRWTGIYTTPGGEAAEPVEAALVDGGIFPVEVIKNAGPPRTDFFMMFEDADFTLRMGRAGSQIFISDAVRSTALHRGSSGISGSEWRAYYQTRNSVRSALDLRHRKLLVASLARFSKQMAWAAFHGGDKRGRLMALRVKGLHNALTGVMGITVHTDSASGQGSRSRRLA